MLKKTHLYFILILCTTSSQSLATDPVPGGMPQAGCIAAMFDKLDALKKAQKIEKKEGSEASPMSLYQITAHVKVIDKDGKDLIPEFDISVDHAQKTSSEAAIIGEAKHWGSHLAKELEDVVLGNPTLVGYLNKSTDGETPQIPVPPIAPALPQKPDRDRGEFREKSR